MGSIEAKSGSSYMKRTMAAIIRCDLSPRFFCIDATLLCKFESDKI